MRNIAAITRQTIDYKQIFQTGITASVPVCKAMDSLGNKAWVVDVYTGPAIGNNDSILKDVLIASTAKQLIGDIRQPVRLEKSKQGKYTVVGRAEFIPAGAQGPSGSILEPTYHETKVNLAEIGLLFLADLDYEIAPYGEGNWGEGDWSPVRAWDAFGVQVFGPEVDPGSVPPKLSPTPASSVVARHVVIELRPYGEGNWGEGDWAGSRQRTIEHTE